MYIWKAFNASSTSKLIIHKEDIQVSPKLLNNQRRIWNNFILLRLY